MGERNGSFISELIAKLSYTIKVQEETGKSTAGAQKEVKRQIKQANTGGDPVKGEGVTKSGESD